MSMASLYKLSAQLDAEVYMLKECLMNEKDASHRAVLEEAFVHLVEANSSLARYISIMEKCTK